MIVGSRQEFYKDLADYTDARLLDIKDFNVIKVVNDIAAEFFELPA